MSIRAKLLSSFLFLTLLIFIQFLISHFFSLKEKELISEILLEHEISAQLSGLAIAAQKIRRFEKEYFIYVEDPVKRDKYYREFGEARDEINQYLVRLKKIYSKSSNKNQQVALSVWQIATAVYSDGFENLNERVKNGEITTVIEANRAIQDVKNKFRVVLTGTASSIESQYKLARNEAALIQQHKRTSSMISIIVSAISVLIALIMSFRVPSSIVRPIQHLTHIANRMSKGQVDQPVKVTGSSEIITLAKSIERMQVATVGLLKRLQTSKRATRSADINQV